MKVLVAVLCFVVSGCATTQDQKPHVVGKVDSYSDTSLERTSPIYFSTEGQDLGQKQIVDECKAAATDSGLVVENSAKGALVVKLSGAVTGTAQGPSMAFVPPAYRGGMPMAVSSTQTSTIRQIGLAMFDKKKEVLRSTITSKGSSESVAPVAYEMCKGFFQGYPQNRQGAEFTVESK